MPVLDWMRERPVLPIAACALYLALIVAGRAYFAGRDRWNWRRALASWNLALSLFSFVGAVRTAPQLIHNLLTMSLRDNMCLDPRTTYGGGSTGLWVQLFILSKFPYVELQGCPGDGW
jgi:hypothetical protein